MFRTLYVYYRHDSSTTICKYMSFPPWLTAHWYYKYYRVCNKRTVYGTRKTLKNFGCTILFQGVRNWKNLWFFRVYVYLRVYGIGELRAVTYAQIDFLPVTLVCEQKEGISAIDMAQRIICSWLEGSNWPSHYPFSNLIT